MARDIGRRRAPYGAARRNARDAPLRRVAEPADIAGAILFLASDLSRYVGGQTLVVDGVVGQKFPYPSGA